MTSKTGKLSDWFALITGANGFVGTHLVQALAARGAAVAAISRRPPMQDLPKVQYLTMELGEGELGEVRKILPMAPKHQVFIHLAGMNHVGRCEQDPDRAFRENVTLTEKCFRFCQELRFEKFIFSSSGLVLGTHSRHPLNEKAPFAPESTYAKTKAQAETVLEQLSRTNLTQCASIRFANLFGKGANPDTLIEKLMLKAGQGAPRVHPGPNHYRDFLLVDDAVAAICDLIVAPWPQKYDVFHISSGQAEGVDSIAKIISCLVGSTKQEQVQPEQASGSFLALDNAKLHNLTGWLPKHGLEESLRLLAKEKGLIDE